MGQILTTPSDLPQYTQSLALGETRYRLRLTWRERLRGWYADLWTTDGTAVWLGQRLSSDWAIGAGLVPQNAPDGLLLVRGPADYSRADLGASLKLVFYATEDLPAATVVDPGVSVSA